MHWLQDYIWWGHKALHAINTNSLLIAPWRFWVFFIWVIEKYYFCIFIYPSCVDSPSFHSLAFCLKMHLNSLTVTEFRKKCKMRGVWGSYSKKRNIIFIGFDSFREELSDGDWIRKFFGELFSFLILIEISNMGTWM